MVKRLVQEGQRLLSSQQSTILSAALVITVSSLVSAVLGLLRNRLLISHFFGTEVLRAQLDAYWVAFRLPELAFQILVIGALSAAFIPVFSQYLQQDKEEANEIAVSMMNIVIGLFFIISVVIFIFAEPFNSLITSTNFSESQIGLAAQLTRIMLLAQLFFGVSNFLTGIIQAHHRFLIPALSPLAYNVGIIIGIVLLSPMIGIYGPAVGVVLGALLHLILQLPLAIRLGFSYRPLFKINHEGVRKMLRLMPPRVLAISTNQLELFSLVYFATALSAGSLTIINIAQQLMSAPIRIFSVPLGQASLPFLSKHVAEKKMEEFTNTLVDTLHQILFLAFPAGMLLLILRIPLVRLAYGAAEFPWPATLLTGKAVAILSISLFAQGGIHVLVRGFYALHNTLIPFVTALIATLVSISLAYLSVFRFDWGVIGLAVAISAASLIHFFLLLLMLLRRLELPSFASLVVSPIKILICTSVMGVSLWVPMRFLDQYVFDTTRTVPLIALTMIASAIGGGVYLGFSKLLQVPELYVFSQLISKVGNWRRGLTAQEEVPEPPTSSQEIRPL